MKLQSHRIVLACVLCGGEMITVGRAFDAQADAASSQTAPNEIRESFPTLDFEAAKLELDATPTPFADWMLVEAGNLDWVGPNGEKLPLNDPHSLSSPDEARAVPFCLASGVAIKTQPAEKSGVFSDMVPSEYQWEQGTLKANTLLFDEEAQRYRVW